MHLVSKWGGLTLLVVGLVLGAGCGERPKITYYLIYPAAGQEKVTDRDEDQIRKMLDQVAAAYQMSKTKPSDEDVFRYYQPTPSLPIGFYAKRGGGKVAVHLMPLSPGVEKREYYQQFHKSLVEALSQSFQGRVASMVEP